MYYSMPLHNCDCTVPQSKIKDNCFATKQWGTGSLTPVFAVSTLVGHQAVGGALSFYLSLGVPDTFLLEDKIARGGAEILKIGGVWGVGLTGSSGRPHKIHQQND